MLSVSSRRSALALSMVLFVSFLSLIIALTTVRPAGPGDVPPLVFVSRQIPPEGSIYWNVPNALPGVGPHSRFRPAAPGKLLVREADGVIRTLIDGANPTSASLNLIDVNAPDVSFDGETIVFAGLPAGNYNPAPARSLGAWRLYTIRADGTGLRQVTFSDQNFTQQQLRDHFPPDTSGFPQAADRFFHEGYDDTDPCWLPDGRIVFSSTRWYAFAQYSGVRASNLFLVNADGTGLHRITAERNGADRPTIDPISGKIVYARWWRNHRFAKDDTTTVADPNGGYIQKDGLTTDRGSLSPNAEQLFRNAWQIAAIRPDGTDLVMWSGVMRSEPDNHFYGGAFTQNGELYGNFFPMLNMTEASGFGGIRRYRRGANAYTPILGITALSNDYIHPSNPTSFGIYNGSYAAEPEVLPDGRLVVSWAKNTQQDYGLFVCNPDGTGRRRLLDFPGTTELRARVLLPRPLPPILTDQVTQVASLLPPKAEGPYNQDGTFIFECVNIYANAPVDSDIVSAPPIGSARSILFFLDQQRSSPGAFPNLDWPISLGSVPIEPDGFLRRTGLPANVSLFEQVRSQTRKVPITGVPFADGAAHVTGMNFGRPGTVARCVGCHTGHSMMTTPPDRHTAQWTNLAPGAALEVSSSRDANYTKGLIDRRARKGPIWTYWNSAPGRTNGEWVKLIFPVPIKVRTVRLYNPRFGDEANSSLQVNGATVELFRDAACTQRVGIETAGTLSVNGTVVPFSEQIARVVKVTINEITGTFYGISLASLAEVEVIGSGRVTGRDAPPPPTAEGHYLP